jgi:hypothetical protein
LVPEAREVVFTTSFCGAITIEVVTEAVLAGLSLSVTITLDEKVPLVVGVPEITPVLADKLNPSGKLPELIVQL